MAVGLGHPGRSERVGRRRPGHDEAGMRGIDFTLVMPVAGALLAAWLDVRLGDARPESPIQRGVHAGLSVVALFGAVGLLYLVHGIPQGLFMVVLLTVFFPTLVYALLACLWMLRALSDLTGLAGR